MTEKYRTYHLDRLTERVRAFVKGYWLDHKYGPTVREVTNAMGISSTSVTDYNLSKMRESGAIEYDDFVQRSLRLPEMKITFEE